MEPVKFSYGFVDSGNVVALLFELILDAQVFQIEFSNKDSVLGGVWIRGDQLIAAKILDHRGSEAIEALLTQPDLHSYIVYKLNAEDTANIDPIGSLSEMLYELVSSVHQSKASSLTAVAVAESPSDAPEETDDDDAVAESSATLEPVSDAEPVTEDIGGAVLEEAAVEEIAAPPVAAAVDPEISTLETSTPETPVLETSKLETPVPEAPVPETPAPKTSAQKARTAQPVVAEAAGLQAVQSTTENPTAPSSRADSSRTDSIRAEPAAPAPRPKLASKPPKRAAPRGRILAVVSPKGGVGKTTVSLNLAVALAQQGYSVVLVDADPQGGVTNSLMASGEAPTGVYDVLMRRESFGSVVRGTKLENLRLMPAGRLLADEVITRSGQLSNPELWKRVLETVQRLADIVIVDTPAGVQGVTTPILSAATHVVAVSQPEPLSLRSLPQLHQTLEALAQIGAAAELTGVILNMVQPERPVSLGVLETLSKRVVNSETLLEPMLVRSDLLLRASSSAMPLMFASDPAYQPLKRVFEDLATELLRRLKLERTAAPEESFMVA